MKEILKKLNCLSLIVILVVSGLCTYKTNASEEYDYTEKILNFNRLSAKERDNLFEECNKKFCREEDFIDKYFNAIEPFLISLKLEGIAKELANYYEVLLLEEAEKVKNGETIEEPTWKRFKDAVEGLILKNPEIVGNRRLNPLKVDAIFTLFNGTVSNVE